MVVSTTVGFWRLPCEVVEHPQVAVRVFFDDESVTAEFIRPRLADVLPAEAIETGRERFGAVGFARTLGAAKATTNAGPARATANTGPARATGNAGPARATGNAGPARATGNAGPATTEEERTAQPKSQ